MFTFVSQGQMFNGNSHIIPPLGYIMVHQNIKIMLLLLKKLPFYNQFRLLTKPSQRERVNQGVF